MSHGNDSTEQVGTGSNVFVQALLNNGFRWNTFDQTGNSNEIRYTFAGGGFNADQEMQADAALSEWSKVSGITFTKIEDDVTNPRESAELILILTSSGNDIGGFGGYSGTPNQAQAENTTETVNGDTILLGDLGRTYTYVAANATNNGQDVFDSDDNFTRAGIELFLHEVGHALGLKHPHDYGSTNYEHVFPGVTVNDSSDLGDNSLNQNLYSIMSYNDAVIGGQSVTPMAFDIAAIQTLYGAREEYADGDDDYVIGDTSAATAWRCIWDTGGTDTIRYSGDAAAVIDLRPATLANEEGGGGRPSYCSTDTAKGYGYTIAGDITGAIADENGVTGVIIENAVGGNGNDDLTGNGVDNVLDGKGGNDALDGGGGTDTAVFSGERKDYTVTLLSEDSVQVVSSADGTDTMVDIESFQFSDRTLTEAQLFDVTPPTLEITSSDTDNVLRPGETTTLTFTFSEEVDDFTAGDVQFDSNLGTLGPLTSTDDITYTAVFTPEVNINARVEFTVGDGSYTDVAGNDGAGDNLIIYDATVPTQGGTAGRDTLVPPRGGGTLDGKGGNDLLVGSGSRDALYGGEGNDDLRAGGGNDLLFGEAGNDVMTGGNGADTFVFAQSGFGRDTIKDFRHSQGDKIDLSGLGVDYEDVQIAYTVSSATITIDGDPGQIVLTGDFSRPTQPPRLAESDFLFA